MRIEKTVINVIFDAGKGRVSLASREAVCGEPLGALPQPVRAGYRFVGWMLDGIAVNADTVLQSDSDIRLVAVWEKKKGAQKTSVLQEEKIVAVVLSVVCIMLIAALLVVTEVVSWKPVDDVFVNEETGEKMTERYYVKKTDGKYRLFDRAGELVEQNEDGYYLVASGNQYWVDGETGEWERYAVVDVEGDEQVGVNSLVLMFKQMRKDNIYSIEVKSNEHAPYRFYRDQKGVFQLEGYENVPVSYDQKLFASLCVSTGYTITAKKLDLKSESSTVPRLPDGKVDYASFGLATLTDAEGNVTYTPTTYTITQAMYDKNGNCVPDESVKYTVLIGDKTLPGGGYYAKRADRDAIYILGYTLEDTVLQPVEALVVPQVVDGMNMTSFLCVEDFVLGTTDIDGFADVENIHIDPIIAFSYVDLLARNNTISEAKPYLNQTKSMTGYDINDTNVSKMLTLMSQMEFIGCRKLGLTLDSLKEFKLDETIWCISFKSPKTNERGSIIGYVENMILISPKTENGTYYIASTEHDMIVEVDQYYLSFLEWELNDWYYPNFFSHSISIVKEMSFNINGKEYNFRLDNSQSYMFYETNDKKIAQVDLTTGYLSKDTEGNTIYVDKSGVKHTVRSFDLYTGTYKFRFENVADKKVTYETFREYRFTIDRNNTQTLTVFYENGEEKDYVLVENGTRKMYHCLVYHGTDGNEYSVWGKYATEKTGEYASDYYRLPYWSENRVTSASGEVSYVWERIPSSNLADALMLMDSSGKMYEIAVGTQNLRIYCDQFLGGKTEEHLLDYTVEHTYTTDKGTPKTKYYSALENFRQFYVNLVGYMIEGDIDEEVFRENMGMSMQEYINSHECDVSFTYTLQDAAKNTNLYTYATGDGVEGSDVQYWTENIERTITIRFYRYSDRRSMITVEEWTKDENGNLVSDDTKTVGKFYVLTSLLDNIAKDAEDLLKFDPAVKVSERS